MERLWCIQASLRLLQITKSNGLVPNIHPVSQIETTVRHTTTKHFLPKWKRLRKLKYHKVDIPNLREKFEDMSEARRNKLMKERNMLPPRPWMERNFHISSTGGIFEPYVPPEGDGKKSFITKTGAKQKLEFLEKKSKSMLAIRKIRSYEEDFEYKEFAAAAQEIYISAHTHLAAKERRKMREFVTERCYPEMNHNVKYTTIKWNFVQSLEPPRVVHARVTEVISGDNMFAQVTVRLHTQQKLAVYDRFGRLMHGSEADVKDILEYVVFEKHISNEYGTWRLHDKILPDWLPPKAPSALTYILKEEIADEQAVEELNVTKPAEDADKHGIQVSAN